MSADSKQKEVIEFKVTPRKVLGLMKQLVVNGEIIKKNVVCLLRK